MYNLGSRQLKLHLPVPKRETPTGVRVEQSAVETTADIRVGQSAVEVTPTGVYFEQSAVEVTPTAV